MVGGGDHDCLGLLILDEVEHAAEGLVVGKHLVDLGSGIVVVAGVVNTRPFNHEEETLVAVACSFAQRLHSSLGHFVQRRVLVVLVATVNLVRDVGVGEETKHREVDLGTALETIKASAVRNIVKAVLAG